nr:AhpC/TSA family [uncultured bacterium]AIA14006.1 AhpC/TSA family [uncultured bacterium]
MKAPSFALPDATGTIHTLQEYAGQWLVLYFYPKDETPGCTIEACSLRDARDDLADAGAVVVGISKDTPESHRAFATAHDLRFTLLSDESGTTIAAYGAWGKKMFGVEGILRKTMIINPAGEIVKTYGRVTPLGHGEQVLAELRRLQS